jgi:hypothetical protein
VAHKEEGHSRAIPDAVLTEEQGFSKEKEVFLMAALPSEMLKKKMKEISSKKNG